MNPLVQTALVKCSRLTWVALARGIRTDQVSVLEVKAIELIAGLLGVVYILIDHKSGTLGVVGDDLAIFAVQRKKKKDSIVSDPP